MQLFIMISIKKSKVTLPLSDYIIEAKEKYDLVLELLDEKHGFFKDTYKLYFFSDDVHAKKNLQAFLKYLRKEGFEINEY